MLPHPTSLAMRWLAHPLRRQSTSASSSSSSSSPLLLLLSLCLCLCLLPSPSHAMIYLNQSFHIPAIDYIATPPPTGSLALYTWQTSSSGSFYVSVTITPPSTPPSTPTNYSMQAVLCSRSGLTDLGFTSSSPPGRMAELLCPDWNLTAAATHCPFTAVLGNHTLLSPPRWSAEAELHGRLDNDWYYLIFMNCANIDGNLYKGNDLDGEYSVVAQSRPGEYLSLSYVPHKSLFIVASVLWLLLLLVWAVHLWQHRAWNVRLQVCMLAVPLSKVWLGVPSTLLYLNESSTGLISPSLTLLVSLTTGADALVLFTVLALTAKGWRILHPTLLPLWKKEFALYLVLMLATYVVVLFRPGYLFTVGFILCLMAFRYIFTSVMANTISIINSMQALLVHPLIDPASLPLWHKLHMYKTLQFALVLYFSISLITYFWASFFLSRMPWVEEAMEAAFAIALATTVGYTFALKPFNPYYYPITMLYCQRGEQGELLPSNNAAPSAPSRPRRRRRRAEREDGAEPRTASAGRGVEDADGGGESSGRRALRAQNRDMRASLLEHDYLVAPHALSPLSPAVSAFTPPPRPSSLTLWHPGLPIPPVPADPKAWLTSPEESSAPILILEQPDRSVVVGQYVSDVPRQPMIPKEALEYFPQELVEMLEEGEEEEEEEGEEERGLGFERVGREVRGRVEEGKEERDERERGVERSVGRRGSYSDELSGAYVPPSLSSAHSGDSEGWRREEEEEEREREERPEIARGVSMQALMHDGAGRSDEDPKRRGGEEERKMG